MVQFLLLPADGVAWCGLLEPREALRGEVAALAAAGASKILGKEIDAKSHAKLIDELVSEIKVG